MYGIFTYIDPIKINHSWIGKYSSFMDGMGNWFFGTHFARKMRVQSSHRAEPRSLSLSSMDFSGSNVKGGIGSISPIWQDIFPAYIPGIVLAFVWGL